MAFRGRLSIAFVLTVVLAAVLGVSADPPGETADEPAAASQPDQVLDVDAWSVDSGGGSTSGGDFTLTAAIGQPDAGELTAGDTALSGGLWAGGAIPMPEIFADGFETGDTSAWSSTVGGTEATQ